ncbi:TetR/AcrR family transcriptional regulator [Amycolatopsis sacchari]|uniref:TetR/AcrR family transcriptional regulator n=1 Tax=Amycolatopsis sacchari TaxID=115433 RepID=UPI003D70F4BA
MSTERSGAGDPARTLRLLWRDPAAAPKRGPRQGLTIDAVVDAATALADAEGLEAVSMRRVAQALGVAPMTLYTYVPGKAELLDLMLDAAYARMPREDTSGRPWRERLTVVAEENLALYRTHPWAAGIATNRPVLGPGQLAKYEHELSALDGLDLDDVTLDDALAFLLAFVRSCAQAAAAQQRDDQSWWDASEPLLARVFDEKAYPRAVRVGSAAGQAHGSAYDPEHAFRFGLARVLDGLAALVAG